MTRADAALKAVVGWPGGNEPDLYPYLKDLFRNVFGYPSEYVKIGETKAHGFPDISLVPRDAKPKDRTFWLVCEVKPEPGRFRTPKEREDVWRGQLRRYVSADTIYALLIDPTTIVVLRPDGSEVKGVYLDEVPAKLLVTPEVLGFLSFDNSVSQLALEFFREGQSPSLYIDVREEDGRDRFYEALRLSARELVDYAESRLQRELADYTVFERELQSLMSKTIDPNPDTNPSLRKAIKELEVRHHRSVRLIRTVLEDFKRQVGKQLPGKAGEQTRFLVQLFASEASSLVLSRILFVRFFEDYDMTTKKVSNGGIKKFREFHRHIKDDYRFLLTNAYKDLERIYRRLFEESIFDWAHDENGELSKLLLRIFYRLNAFDFRHITGDILGNLYERFLDPERRKKLGEFYTPEWVADYILDRIGFFDNPGPLLDPACGSGTFLIRAVEGLIQRRTAPPYNVSVKSAVEQAISLVHGLDINVFAAFIAQLQLIWHLFPYLKEAGIETIPDLKVYGGLNSLAYDVHGLDRPIQTLSESEALAVREPSTPYRYVVGNPPYIRTERLKEEETPWRELYSKVDFGKSDISFFFVHRALEGAERKVLKTVQKFEPWLEEDGTLGFVLPLGISDTVAAGLLRTELLENQLLEIVDLEEVAHDVFTSQIARGRATVAPMLLMVRKSAPKEEIAVRVVGPSPATAGGIDIRLAPLSSIPRELFQVSDVNPYGQFLTKLKKEDVPILKKLMVGRKSVADFAALMGKPKPKKDKEENGQRAVTIGVSVGTGRKVSQEEGGGLTPIGKGGHVYAYYVDLDGISEYTDLDKVQGKSIWAYPSLLMRPAYAFSEIALAPHAGRFNPSTVCLSKSAVLFVPDEPFVDFPWDAYFNSIVPRFVFATVLRSGLVGAGTINPRTGAAIAWSTIHVRVAAALPVSEALLGKGPQLRPLAEELRDLAARINKRWRTVEEAIGQAAKKPLALCNVDFADWTSLGDGERLELESSETESWLQAYEERGQQKLCRLRGPKALLKVILHLLGQGVLEGDVSREKLETLSVPENFEDLSSLIENAKDENSPEITRFRELVSQVDAIVEGAFGLDAKESGYVKTRLKTPPMDNFQPRYPWEEVARRAMVTYEEDRFA